VYLQVQVGVLRPDYLKQGGLGFLTGVLDYFMSSDEAVDIEPGN
jgi:hypothetical protein